MAEKEKLLSAAVTRALRAETALEEASVCFNLIHSEPQEEISARIRNPEVGSQLTASLYSFRDDRVTLKQLLRTATSDIDALRIRNRDLEISFDEIQSRERCQFNLVHVDGAASSRPHFPMCLQSWNIFRKEAHSLKSFVVLSS